jgi:non-ribosomal peptide synthetase component F
MNSQLTSSGARALPVPAAWTGAEAHRPYKVERLDQIVAQQAVRTPTAVALHEGSRSITYGDMMRQARRLAHILRARDIGREDLVAVCIDRSIEQMVSVLGVLLAGAAYVPIDPQGPAERRRFMLEDSRPRAILTRGSF